VAQNLRFYDLGVCDEISDNEVTLADRDDSGERIITQAELASVLVEIAREKKFNPVLKGAIIAIVEHALGLQ